MIEYDHRAVRERIPRTRAVAAIAALLGRRRSLAADPADPGSRERFAALALFAFNIVAVISYPDLSDAGLKDHMLWGALLLVTFFHGPGKWSLDHFFGRRFVPIAGIPRV
jgi:hypothetical protein